MEYQSILYLAPRCTGKTTWLATKIVEYLTTGGSIHDILVIVPNSKSKYDFQKIYMNVNIKLDKSRRIEYPTIKCSSPNIILSLHTTSIKVIFWDEPNPTEDDRTLFKMIRQKQIQQIIAWTPMYSNSFINNPPADFDVIKN